MFDVSNIIQMKTYPKLNTFMWLSKSIKGMRTCIPYQIVTGCSLLQLLFGDIDSFKLNGGVKYQLMMMLYGVQYFILRKSF